MSINPKRKPEDEEEEGTMIPVFTVIKNGVILKNIFVVNKPPPHFSGLSSIKFVEYSENSNQDTEEILIVGRHPDCNIVLMHPSISRFHLQIDSNPSLRKLFVTDLSSVHGTWISEKKIDPGFRVELKEGDTIRMGGSTRVYRLHWVPLSCAYDSENPFVSESDLALIEENEEENVEKMSPNEDLLAIENKNVEEKDSLTVVRKAEDTNQVIDSFDSEKGETQSVDSILEDVVSLFHGGQEEIEDSSGNDHELSLKSVGGAILQTLSAIFYDCNQSPEYLSAEEDIDISIMTRLELESRVEFSSDCPSSISEVNSASKIAQSTRSQSLTRKENEQKIDTLPLQSVHLSMPAGELSDTDNEYVNKENQTPEHVSASNLQSLVGNIGSTTDNQQFNELLNLQIESSDDNAATGVLEETKNQSPLMKEGILREATSDDPADIGVLGEKEDPSPSRNEGLLTKLTIDDPAATEVLEETEVQSPSKKECILNMAIIDDPAAIDVFGETENRSPSRKESILNEPTINDPAATEVFGETGNQSPSTEEVILREPTIDDPAAIGVLGETDDLSPIMKEGILREEKSDDPFANGVLGEKEDQSPLKNEGLLMEPTIDDPAAIEVLEETDDLSHLMKEGVLREAKSDDPVANGVLGEKEDQSPLKNEGLLMEPTIDDPAATEVLEETEDQSPLRKECILNEPTIDDSASIEVFGDSENQSPSMKEGILREPTTVSTVYPEAEEPPKSSMPRGEALPQNTECQTPQSKLPERENLENIMSSCDRSEKRMGSSNIWSRRGKPASSLQLQTSRSQRKTKGGDETDAAAKWENQENVECKSIRQALFSDLEGMVEEIYTPDKENCNPNTSELRSLKRNVESKSTARALLSDLDGIDDENFTINKENLTPITSILRSKKKLIIELEDSMITSSDKENQTPQILREMSSARLSRHRSKLDDDIVLKERRADRVPLQSLISNSPVSLSDASFPSTAKRSSSSINCNQKKVTNSDSINSIRDGRRRWTMIADTTSLLNKETRNALQLLEGLKGTHLIIPRIVIRELDSLKRCNSLFRRKTEASVVLEWIEECMVKTKWWIHVQNSVEEVRPIAPTPPATPVSQIREGSEVFPFSDCGTPAELVSPTAEDHIIDCAVFYRKMNNDRRLAILSNNVTLKIKAMAEGLICETAQEFRDSLVNPFSERFLWADSSPRGQTWSVFDDVVLKEKYYRSPSKKSSREGAKGLKLILLHNSHYVKTL